jgi:exopolysaccharide transport family protein
MDAKVSDALKFVAYPAALRATDPQLVVSTLRRNSRLLMGVSAVVLAAVVGFTLLSTPKYTATASVLLDTRKHNVTGIEDVLSGLPADTSMVDTQVEILKSRALAERVVSVLKLDEDPEFNVHLGKPGLLAGLLGAGDGGGSPSDPASLESQRRHEAVVDRVLDHVRVKRAGLTYVIKVGFESKSAERAALIANTFADRYLLEQLEAKFEATRNANTWLNERLTELRGQVQQSEAAVEAYKAANGLLSASGSNLTEQEISNLNQQLALVKVQQAEAEARLSTARAQLAHGSSGDDVGEALGSTVIQGLRGQRTEVTRKLAELRSKYGLRHPEVLKTQGELADIDNQIQTEIKRIVSNMEAQAQVARQRTASLEASLAASRGTLVGNNRAAVRLHEMERDADSVRGLYESFLNRFKQTNAQEGTEISDARKISPAKLPDKPSSPNVPLNLAIGFVLALAAGAGAVFLREALDTGIGTSDDIEKQLDLAYLGGIPIMNSTLDRGKAVSTDPVDYVVEKPLASFAESFRNLRTSLQFSRLGERVQVVAITSSLPDEGKTTTSLCLARTMALSGDRVVVVDCDLRKRAVNRVLPAEPEVGLIEVLSGQVTLEQALIVDMATGARLLPLAHSAFTPKDVFGSPAMDRLLDDLRARFDFIILDTAPVLPVADTRTLAAKADAVALLVRWRKTPRKASEAALKLLQNGDTHIAGAVLTQIDMHEQARYGYGDAGYYYKAYRKYYAA